MLLQGPASDPRVLDRRVVVLSDPDVPDSIQPFHAGLDRPRAAGAGAVKGLIASVRSFSHRSIADLVAGWRAAGHAPVRARVVVGSVGDPATIANDHIRAHAEEGRLFRLVVEEGLDRCGIAATVTAEKHLLAPGAKALGMPLPRLKARLAGLGRGLTGGWRAEDKAAALAAWLLLE